MSARDRHGDMKNIAEKNRNYDNNEKRID